MSREWIKNATGQWSKERRIALEGSLNQIKAISRGLSMTIENMELSHREMIDDLLLSEENVSLLKDKKGKETK